MSTDTWPGDPKRREALLRLPLAELADWHLVVACGACPGDRYLRLDVLADRYGGDSTLAVLLPRLRCGTAGCGRPACRVRLRNRFPVHPGPKLIDVMLKG